MAICSTTGKTMYDSEKDAQKGLSKMIERLPSYTGEPYFCLYCSNYHFGQRKDKPVKNKRKRT